MGTRQIFIVGLIILLHSGIQAASSKVSGVTFMHYSFKNVDENGFHINRAYLTYENRVSEVLSYTLQMDVAKDDVSAYSAYMKTAKVDWKTAFGKLTLGLQTMNMFKVQENTWGYRFIEKSAMDLGKFSSSADLGLGWSYAVGPVNTSLMITNGAGYKKAENDGYKKISTRFHLGQAKLKEGYNAGLVGSFEGFDYGAELNGNSLVVGGFAGFAVGPAVIGAEYSERRVSAATETISYIMSTYGRIGMNEEIELFLRADHMDPNADQTEDADTYIIAGGIYNLVEGLTLAPNLRFELSQSGQEDRSYFLNFQFKY